MKLVILINWNSNKSLITKQGYSQITTNLSDDEKVVMILRNILSKKNYEKHGREISEKESSKFLKAIRAGITKTIDSHHLPWQFLSL